MEEKCYCGEEAVVGLNGVSLCMEHYEERIAKIGEIVRSIPNAVGFVVTPKEQP